MSNESFDEYDDPDRPRGIFTESDREYIRSRGDGYSRQAAHARREAIQNRFYQALLDLSLLADLPDVDRQELLLSEAPSEDVERHSRTETRAALAFFYNLVDDLGGGFESLLEDAIVQAAQRPEGDEVIFRTAEVDISPPDTFDMRRIEQFINDPESVGELTRQELSFLLVIAYEIDEDGRWEQLVELVASVIWEHQITPDKVDPFYDREINYDDMAMRSAASNENDGEE